jgi:hypothetical protein
MERNSSVTPSVILGPKVELLVYLGSAPKAEKERTQRQRRAKERVKRVLFLPIIIRYLLEKVHVARNAPKSGGTDSEKDIHV